MPPLSVQVQRYNSIHCSRLSVAVLEWREGAGGSVRQSGGGLHAGLHHSRALEQGLPVH